MSKVLPYYLGIQLFFFILLNIRLKNLVVSGIFYIIAIVVLHVMHLVLLVWKNETLKWKGGFYCLFLFCIIFSKNIFHFIFLLNTIIVLSLLNLKRNRTMQVVLIVLISMILLNSHLIFFSLLFVTFNQDGIYEDTHYLCDEKYEIYIHSAGAMDSFHYTIIQKENLINLNNLLKIGYNKPIGNTLEQYNQTLKQYTCRRVGA